MIFLVYFEMFFKYIRSLRPLTRYNKFVVQHPTFTMATTSSLSMGLGNYICQLIAEGKDSTTLDYNRIFKFAIYGFFISVSLKKKHII
jgi:hypothetical protein